jgi:hypothetical protein
MRIASHSLRSTTSSSGFEPGGALEEHVDLLMLFVVAKEMQKLGCKPQ